MKISNQLLNELEGIVKRHERENGVIDLSESIIANCQCTGSHCSTGCSGNGGETG